MGLKLDKNNTGFKILPEGEYEVYPIAFAREKIKSGPNAGAKMAQFNYIVRDDVDQEGKGQEIRFDNFMELKNTLWRVNQASDAAGMDMEKEYEDIYEWAEDFKHRAVRVTVSHRTYNGKTYPQVDSFAPSLYGGTYVPKEEKDSNPVASGEPVEINDDDLPF